MCFGYEQVAPAPELKIRFKAKFPEANNYEPAEFISGFTHPSTPIITNQSPELIQLYQWGLIPSWAKDNTIQKSTLNAKIETLTERPSFKSSITQRCLIPVNGFYEWKWLDEKGKRKEKYHITTADSEIFTFAGLWNTWINPLTNQPVHTYTILTTEADELMAEIHNTKKRMPVILKQDSERDWLLGNKEPIIDHNLIATLINPTDQISLF